jgi:hypothetical protein
MRGFPLRQAQIGDGEVSRGGLRRAKEEGVVLMFISTSSSLAPFCSLLLSSVLRAKLFPLRIQPYDGTGIISCQLSAFFRGSIPPHYLIWLKILIFYS